MTSAPPLELTWTTYPADAAAIIEDTPTRYCRQPRCQAPIWWGTTAANGKRCPFDIKPDGIKTGTSHWRTCRQRPGRKG